MTITFYAPTIFARYIQLLVMKYGGYFVHNPLFMFTDKSQFKISFDNISPEAVYAFNVRINILNQPWV